MADACPTRRAQTPLGCLARTPSPARRRTARQGASTALSNASISRPKLSDCLGVNESSTRSRAAVGLADNPSSQPTANLAVDTNSRLPAPPSLLPSRVLRERTAESGRQRSDGIDYPKFRHSLGGVAEWLNAALSKSVVRLIGVPGVRISPPPLHRGSPRRSVGDLSTTHRCTGHSDSVPAVHANSRQSIRGTCGFRRF